MKRFVVVTSEYQTYSATETDPPEWGADVIEIEAESAREAVKFGVKVMLADPRHYGYCEEQRSDGLCPYTGVKAWEV